MSGFLGIGGKQSKDYGTAQEGMGDLKNVFNFGLKQATNLSNAGPSNVASGVNAVEGAQPTIAAGGKGIGDSLNYFKNLVSGNRTMQTQVAAPEVDAQLKQNDAARRSAVATGTARGGGVAATNQTQHDDMLTRINNAIFGVRPAAASQEVGAGTALAQTGLGSGELGLGVADVGNKQSGLGLEAGGLAGQSGQALTTDALKSREDSYNIQRQQSKDIAGIVASIFG